MSTPVYAQFDQSALDREYSPSSCIADISIYLDAYADRSAAARQSALADGLYNGDLRYGDGPDETLDLFLPRTAETAALQVYIHGGYWQLLSKDESSFAAGAFQRHGAAFAALNYTLAPQQSLSGIVEENRRAIAWLYNNADRLGFDRERIFLSGSSAGAHLAIMMLLTDWPAYKLPKNAIKGVCAVSGIYDLEPVRLSYVNDKVGMDSREATDNSPLQHLLRNTCPVILAYGDNETAEFKRQTDDFRKRLVAGGTDVTFREIRDRNHFDVILDLADDSSWLFRSIQRQMIRD